MFQVEMRTLRVGIVNLAMTIGISLGFAMSGILYKIIGFYGVYMVSAILYTFCLIYGIFYVKDFYVDNITPVPIIKSLEDFFIIQHVKKAFYVTFKKDNNNRRIRVIMLMLVLITLMGPISGQ